MVKVEAVVIRERVETVIDAVEEETGHVGVTVVEAIGHGRERGITHEYRGRVFESRFLPKALLTFVVPDEIAEAVVAAAADAARSGNESGDGLVWTTTVGERHPQPDRQQPGGGRGRMTLTNKELVIATSTIWVVIAAILVMFMQAGFAFLEAGLTRMKNVGHVAAKNVLVLGIASIVYYLVGYGLAFGDGGNAIVGGSGFFPSVDELLAIGASPFSWFSTIPAGAGYLFQVVFAAVALAIVWGAMAERTKLWVYFAFGVVFTLIYSVVSHWIWHPDGWLFARGMQDFAGSTVVHYQGALAALAGALLLGPRIGKFGPDGKPNAIPGHNMAFVTLGVIILWFGWFGFNPGSTLGVVTGDKLGYFAYVALTTNVAAAAGALGAVAVSWIVIKKPDLSMMLNGVIAALVAITAACGFVAPWAAIVIGAVAGSIAVLGVLGVERLRVDDPIGAVSVHGLAGVWGTLATGIFAVPALADNLATGTGGLVYTGSFHQLGVQALGLLAVGIFTFSASFGALWAMKKTFGIRVEPEVETAGLDVSEHGMWGYPEFYIPVPGGYGTESHGHLGLAHARSAPAHAHPHPQPSRRSKAPDRSTGEADRPPPPSSPCSEQSRRGGARRDRTKRGGSRPSGEHFRRARERVERSCRSSCSRTIGRARARGRRASAARC